MHQAIPPSICEIIHYSMWKAALITLARPPTACYIGFAAIATIPFIACLRNWYNNNNSRPSMEEATTAVTIAGWNLAGLVFLTIFHRVGLPVDAPEQVRKHLRVAISITLHASVSYLSITHALTLRLRDGFPLQIISAAIVHIYLASALLSRVGLSSAWKHYSFALIAGKCICVVASACFEWEVEATVLLGVASLILNGLLLPVVARIVQRRQHLNAFSICCALCTMCYDTVMTVCLCFGLLRAQSAAGAAIVFWCFTALDIFRSLQAMSLIYQTVTQLQFFQTKSTETAITAMSDHHAKMRRDILRFMCHHLRTASNAMQLAADSALLTPRRQTADIVHSLCNEIHERVVDIEKVLEDLGNLDAWMAGNFTLQSQPQHLSAVAIQVVNRMQRCYPNRSITFYPCDGDEDVVNIDATRFLQVIGDLTELVLTVIPDSGSVDFHVRKNLAEISRTSGTAATTVTDTDILRASSGGNVALSIVAHGVLGDSPKLEGLFAPSLTNAPDGLSVVSLSIAKELIHRMGGRLTCTVPMEESLERSVTVSVVFKQSTKPPSIAVNVPGSTILSARSSSNISATKSPLSFGRTTVPSTVLLAHRPIHDAHSEAYQASAPMSARHSFPYDKPLRPPFPSLPDDVDTTVKRIVRMPLDEGGQPNAVTTHPFAPMPEWGLLETRELGPSMDLNLASPRKLLTSAVIVDDVPSNCVMLRRMLRLRGTEDISLASNGVIALALLEQNPALAASVWFIDRNMPLMDGNALVSALRSKGLTGTTLIGVTGDSLPSDLASFVAAGLDGVVTKPVRIGEIEEMLEACGWHFPTSLHNATFTTS